MTTPDRQTPMERPQPAAQLVIVGAVFAGLSTVLAIAGLIPLFPLLAGLAAFICWVLAAYRVAAAIDQLALQRYEKSRFRV